MGENLAWDIADTLNGMMMLPNLVGVLVLSPVVVRITKNYIDRRLKHRDVEPLLSNFEDIKRKLRRTSRQAANKLKRGRIFKKI